MWIRTRPFALAVAVLSAATAGILLPAPSRALDLAPLRAETSPSFTADVTVSLDAEGATSLTVSVSVPFGELQWIRLPQGYGAGFEVTAAFQRQGRSSGAGDSWERKIAVDRFELTTSRERSVIERRSFRLPPGRYDLRVRVHDLNSERESAARERLDVPDYSRVPLAIAGMELGRVETDGSFTAVTTRSYGHDSERLAARVSLVDRRPGGWPRTYSFAYRLLDESGQEILAGHRAPTVAHLGDPILIRPDSSALFVGTYTLEVTLEDGKGRWKSERSFEVEESGPPRGREFRRMLEPLSYIASAQEVATLEHVSDAEQPAAWEEFWRRRDPSPDTPRNEALIEFLRRVRYAEDHFQHFGPGWRSDKGRIYIKFGPPDQIETRPPTSQSPQLEIWYYNQPFRQFVFADRDGFGRYVLVSPGAE